MMWLKRGTRKTISLTCILAIFVLGACQSVAGPPLEQLLIDQEDLPGEWVVSVEGPQPPSGDAPLGKGIGAIEALVVYFYHPAGDGSAGAHEKIFHFRTYSEAEESYDKMIQTAFKYRLDWYWAPAAFEVPSLSSASERLLRCTNGRTAEICRLVARYGLYLLDLKVDLYGLNSQLEPVRVISYDRFPEIIDAVEDRMGFITTDEK